MNDDIPAGARGRASRSLRRLAADFPGWDFAAQPVRDGLALVAIRRDQAGVPGTCAVITSDPGEMRRALGGNP
jgi:hypothetical protein